MKNITLKISNKIQVKSRSLEIDYTQIKKEFIAMAKEEKKQNWKKH